jgi:hypothetical protein
MGLWAMGYGCSFELSTCLLIANNSRRACIGLLDWSSQLLGDLPGFAAKRFHIASEIDACQVQPCAELPGPDLFQRIAFRTADDE